MSLTSPQRLRRIGSGAAVGALVASTLLLTAPAQAAAAVTVTAADIAPNESTYAGWHQGATNAGKPGIHDVNSKGLQLIGRSQVIKGYANNTKTLDVKNATLSKLRSAAVDVNAGAADFQVPLFFSSDLYPTTQFTTLRPETAVAGGEHTFTNDKWISTKKISNTVEANVAYPLNDIIAAINDYKTLGFGVYNQAGTASVGSLTFDGTTYNFSPAANANVTVKNADVDGYEDGNYSRWHQGYAKSLARHQVTADGLELASKSQIIKGFANNSNTLDTNNVNLAAQLQDSGYTMAEGAASFQIPLFFNDSGTTRFATLRSADESGSTGFEPDDLFLSSRAIGSVPANTEVPLSTLVAALGTDYKVIGFGVNATLAATVSDITFAGTKYTFSDTPAVTSNETIKNAGIKPGPESAATYVGWHQGGDGTQTVGADGVTLTGPRSQVINGYANNTQELDAKNIRLEDAVRGAAFTVKSGTVSFQVPIFYKDGADVKFTTLRSADFGEGTHTLSIQDSWVSSRALPGLPAADSYVLADIIDSLKDYKVLAYGVYNQAGAATVSDITWDGKKTTFKAVAPVAGTITANASVGTEVTVTLTSTSSDGSPVTYTTTAPGATIVDGNKLKFTPSAAGSKVIAFTATSEDGSSNGTVTLTVAKAASTTALSVPKSFKIKKSTKATVTVTSPGAVAGDTVELYMSGSKVGTGTLAANKKVEITFKISKSGSKRVLVAKYLGNANANASETSTTVKVTK